MAYRFQSRIARDGQYPDVDRMNTDLMPASEGSWNLDEENFAANAFGASRIGSEAHVKSYYDENAISTGITDAALPAAPLAAATATTILNTGDWTECDAYIDITTGGAMLYVEGNLQYIRHTFGGAAPYHDPDDGDSSTGAIFGLRVRGVVFPFTSTEDPKMTPPVPLRATFQRGTDHTGAASTTRLPGPATPRQDPCGACGPELAPVHMTTVLPVPAGTHRVQLVAKRAVLKYLADAYDANDYIQVSQEQLYVKVLPIVAPAASSLTGVSIPLFESEDVLSGASLGVDRVAQLRTNLNNVEAGQLRRGAANWHHISPSPLFSGVSVTVGTVSTTFAALSNVYPGYGGAAASWSILTFGGNNVTTGNIAMGTTKVKVKLTATVHVKTIYSNAGHGGAPGGHLGSIGCLAIGETVGGVTTIIAASERYINSFGAPSALRQPNEEITVTLIAYKDFSGGSGGTRSWSVYGACADFAIAGNARMEIRSGRIDAEVENVFG